MDPWATGVLVLTMVAMALWWALVSATDEPENDTDMPRGEFDQ